MYHAKLKKKFFFFEVPTSAPINNTFQQLHYMHIMCQIRKYVVFECDSPNCVTGFDKCTFFDSLISPKCNEGLYMSTQYEKISDHGCFSVHPREISRPIKF